MFYIHVLVNHPGFLLAAIHFCFLIILSLLFCSAGPHWDFYFYLSVKSMSLINLYFVMGYYENKTIYWYMQWKAPIIFIVHTILSIFHKISAIFVLYQVAMWSGIATWALCFSGFESLYKYHLIADRQSLHWLSISGRPHEPFLVHANPIFYFKITSLYWFFYSHISMPGSDFLMK